jgi:hypothetical protein
MRPEERQSCGCLHAFGAEADGVGGGGAKARDLRDRKIDKDNPAIEHLLAERHMRRDNQHSSSRRRA